MKKLKATKMKALIFLSIFILGINSSYLDEESTIKLQKDLDSIPIDKLPIKFRNDSGDKYFLNELFSRKNKSH